ncbi:MAG: putative zinc-binding protein [Planctomycetes bacterium]|nr:putative zinc-binding protein [Planctomycetota bacterium]
MSRKLPMVFACSGCSHAGQLANRMALELDRWGIAQMSCLAGVGAAKQQFLQQLRGREVWIIDGCPIECSLGVFAQVHQHVDVHIRLHELGVRKNAPSPEGSDWEQLVSDVLRYVDRRPDQR